MKIKSNYYFLAFSTASFPFYASSIKDFINLFLRINLRACKLNAESSTINICKIYLEFLDKSISVLAF